MSRKLERSILNQMMLSKGHLIRKHKDILIQQSP